MDNTLKALFREQVKNGGIQKSTVEKYGAWELVDERDGICKIKEGVRRTFTVGMAGGVFDIIHRGHLATLKEAKKLCDFLVVSVANEKNTKKTVIHSQNHRVEMVDALKPVDAAIPGRERIEETVLEVNPDIIIYGYDQKERKIPGFGGKVVKLSVIVDDERYKTSKIKMELGGFLKMDVVDIKPEEGENVIIGQAHFIKTVEDLYEQMAESGGSLKFGIAFCEASQMRLIRHDGNDEELEKKAVEIAKRIGCGHSFVILMKDGWPINVLNRIKMVSEVVSIFAATANPLQVVVYETEQGRGIMGVVDGGTPSGVEKEDDKEWRKGFLRKIGYKR